MEKFPPLRGSYRADVAIIGGGITGVSAALRLREMGKSVVLLDKAEPASGETSFTTAHVTEVLDTRFVDLIEHFGREQAAEIAAASRRGLDLITEMVQRQTISCDYEKVSGYLFSEDLKEGDLLETEAQAMHQLGVHSRLANSAPLPFRTVGCIVVPDQAQIHPLKYMNTLLRLLRNQGGLVFSHSKVNHIEHGEPCEIHTDSAKVTATDVVICSHDPISHPGFLHTKIASYRSYVVAVKPSYDLNSKGLFWDCGDPYHYIRSVELPQGRAVIVGGEDHKTGLEENTAERFDKLTAYAQQRFGVEAALGRWSGQIIETVDGLPYIGRDSHQPHFFVATGFSGNGTTWGTLAAEIISQQIAGLENRWANLFRPNRFNPSVSAGRYVMENADFPVCFLGDRVRDAVAIEAIGVQQGGIVKVDGKRVAVYKGSAGEVLALSPVCPHMGCLVRWNNGEKTWDCPCHGSRFDTHGKVLNGPAVEGLRPVLLEEQVEKIAMAQSILTSRDEMLVNGD